jgi:hypothetical protein
MNRHHPFIRQCPISGKEALRLGPSQPASYSYTDSSLFLTVKLNGLSKCEALATLYF